MRSSRYRIALTVLSIVLCAGRAGAGEYRDPAGFSFNYPDGWTTVTSRNVEAGAPLVAPQIKAWLTTNHVDLKYFSVILIREHGGEVVANLNVVVDPRQLRADDHNAKELLRNLPENYRSVGMRAENLSVRQQKFATALALVVDLEVTMPGSPVPLEQRLAYYPGGGKTFVVTCTSVAEEFDKYGPTFDAILASFKVPAPDAMGIDWTSAVTAGAVCGAAAALVTLFKKLIVIGPKQAV
jgi:hypothetical protein